MKNTFLFLWITLLIAFCYLQSCTFEKGEIPKPVTNATYQAVIKPIMVTYCDGQGTQTCHVTSSNQGANGDFTTYAGLKAKVDNGSIDSRVFNLKDMPTSYSEGPKALSAEDMEKLKSWVNNGALDN